MERDIIELLTYWRNEDQNDFVTLSRNDVCEILNYIQDMNYECREMEAKADL